MTQLNVIYLQIYSNILKRLFETIKIEKHHVYNIEWHNKRLNKSRLELFGERQKIDLRNCIQIPKDEGLYRCRILYKKEIELVEYIPYVPKNIHQFKVVHSTLNYHYKFNDRSKLTALLDKNYDEIIIEKDGLLTDTSIANIAFYNGKEWLTPKIPLLEGTTRERLLAKKFLKLENIKKENIKNYSHFALMNAMIGFQIQKSINIK